MVGARGWQFLKTANYLLSLQKSFKGPDGKVALNVMGRTLAYLAILGGVPALPFLDDLLDLWEKFFGTPGRIFATPGSFAKTGEAVYGVREDDGNKPRRKSEEEMFTSE